MSSYSETGSFPASEWAKLIFDSTPIESGFLTLCALLCLQKSPCQFYAMVDNVCYFGNYQLTEVQNHVVWTDNVTVTVFREGLIFP